MSPRTAKQFKEIRAQKQTLIINTALELFAKNGYHHTSIDMIAKKAGISKGLMYNYFESKEGLMRAILNKGVEEMMEIFDPNKDGILEQQELKDFISASLNMLKENLEFWKLYFSVSLQPAIFPLVKEITDELMGPIMHMTTGYFQTKGFKNPEMESFIFGALMDGIAFQYIMNPEALPVDKIKKALIEKYCSNA